MMRPGLTNCSIAAFWEWISNRRSSRFLLPLLEYWKVEGQRPHLVWGEARLDKEALLNVSRTRLQRRVLLLTLTFLSLVVGYVVWGSNPVQRQLIQWELVRMPESFQNPDVAHALAAIGEWRRAVEIAQRLETDDRGEALEAVSDEMAKVKLSNKDALVVEQVLHETDQMPEYSYAQFIVVGNIVAETARAEDSKRARELLNEAIRRAGKTEFHSLELQRILIVIAEAGRMQLDRRSLKVEETNGPYVHMIPH
jgi:hypothetical protein